jgi:hypothetical protein
MWWKMARVVCCSGQEIARICGKSWPGWFSIPAEALQMGRYGRQVVEKRFSASAHYEELMHIYSSLFTEVR